MSSLQPFQQLLESTRFTINDNSTGNPGDQSPGAAAPTLTWNNVAIASTLILVNAAISLSLGLKLEKSLITASIRCVVQLTIMAYILEDVFKAKDPFLVLLMTCVLIFLGTFETVYNKSTQTYRGMFPSVLVSSACSSLLIGVIGTKWAMGQAPFWVPETFIPTLGMLLGNTMGAIAIALSACLSRLSTHKEQIETYLAFGASRWEAGRAVAMEAVRLAMLPTINQMSLIGLVSIPGMMTGQILGGVPVMNAVHYQQIIMFLISACTSLGVLGATASCINIMFDRHHRLRSERITNGQPSIFQDVLQLLKATWRFIVPCGRRRDKCKEVSTDSDLRQPLLD